MREFKAELDTCWCQAAEEKVNAVSLPKEGKVLMDPGHKGREGTEQGKDREERANT